LNTSLPQIQPAADEKPAVCRMLRTKSAFGQMSFSDEDWTDGESTTAVYWCLGTMETAGPDNVLCHPTTCRVGRECFRPEPE
jgi:hypothetical protein